MAFSLPSWMAATPADVVWQRRSARLLRYRRRGGPAKSSVPLLLVPSMINRYYVLDLMEGRSLVEHLNGQGLDLFMLDWGAARDEDQFLDFDSCLVDILGGAVRRVARYCQAPRVSLLGYCMGGTMCAIYTSLFPQQVANLINLAGPIDFSRGATLFKWTDRRWFDVDLLVDGLGNLPAPLMQSSFSALAPTGNWGKAWALWDRRGDPDFLRSFCAVERWANDNIPFPGEAYRKYIKDLFQQNLLVQDRYRVRGELALLQRISCPVLGIAASKDHIVPLATMEALERKVGSPDASTAVLPGGHVGIVVGSSVDKHLWPCVANWLLPRSGAGRAPGRAGDDTSRSGTRGKEVNHGVDFVG